MKPIVRLTGVAIFVAGLGGANAASATQIFLNTSGLYGPRDVTFSGPVDDSFQAGAFRFEANYGGSTADPKFDIYAFCVDIYRRIDTGINVQKSVNLAYHVEPLVHDSSLSPGGLPLSALQVREIEGLAALGYRILKSGAADLADQMAGIQAAIWTIEYPAATVKAKGAVEAYRKAFVAKAPTLTGKAYALYSNNNRTQGFIVGVPEPGTWVMMIAGFGLAGATLRRRRALSQA